VEHNVNAVNEKGQFEANQLALILRDQITFKQNNVSGILIVSVFNYRKYFITI
jgi:hypothetical protein